MAGRLTLRSIVEEPAYSQNAEIIFGNVVRADQILGALTWQLARAPHFNAYHLVGQSAKYGTVWGTVSRSVPVVVILFALESPDAIVLIDVRAFGPTPTSTGLTPVLQAKKK